MDPQRCRWPGRPEGPVGRGRRRQDSLSAGSGAVAIPARYFFP
jgi:hypothetical protein